MEPLRHGGTRDEVPGDACQAESEQQWPDELHVDAGQILQHGADERVGREVAGHDQEGCQNADPDALVAELVGQPAQADGLSSGQRWQHSQQGGQHDQCEGAQGAERDPPTRQPADHRADRDAEDVRGPDTAEDDRRGPRHELGGDEPDGQTAGDGPESADRHPDQHAGGDQKWIVRGQGGGQVGERHESHQGDEQEPAIHPADEYRDRWRRDGGDDAGDRDHQARRTLRDRQRRADGGEQSDGELLGSHQEECAEGYGGHRDPMILR
jgi:hypothetical protein